MKITVLLLVTIIGYSMMIPPTQGQSMLGVFDQYQDTISTVYDEHEDIYTLIAQGEQAGPTRLATDVEGTYLLTAFFKHDRNAHPSAEIGLTVGQGNAGHLFVLNTLGEASLSLAQGASRETLQKGPKFGYEILQVEQTAEALIFRAAASNEPLQRIAEVPTADGSKSTIGLFMFATDSSAATAWNVRIEGTVPDDYNPYESGHLASRLEVMNVFDGKRKIIHKDEGHFEAPNWMPDSARLLFNQGGDLYTIGTDGTNKTKLNTSFATSNNNDHGISFDGTMLAISHHREGLPEGGSTIYVVDINGGEPKIVTEQSPSYWHGWSPSNEEVVYVAKREQDNYDIYKKNINGGQELRLSDYEGSHADGPEYSPDGEYIYYNACPTGTMQLWRMLSDGWNKEQLTFDEYNDWFPHLSPDGKWIAFLSYPTHINPKSHPANKRVMLRLMPAGGGAPRVIAYLYGGQGTINVPSWSPDSQSIAFVSYSTF